ncbi:MAG: choice-of-anchor tandem repeat NxxGxxAF-containing protein [Bryobacteraceae bacterium]
MAVLGEKTPSGFYHINDYEPGGLNNRGDAIYGTDVGTSADPSTFIGEGAFLRAAGQEFELARAGASAPGGSTFDALILSAASINDSRDAAFAFALSPLGAPTGVNAGLFHYSIPNRVSTAVVQPFITPAPAGGTFQGVVFGTSLTNRGDILFSGIIASGQGVHIPGEVYPGLGVGVFKADSQGQITSIVSPGDPAPGGGLFDYAGNSGAGGAAINAGGDVAFVGHVAGEEAKFPGFPPQTTLISALGSLYIKDAQHGVITSIAHAGESAPGGAIYREIISPALNASGDVAFIGDISPGSSVNQHLAVFLNSKGATLAVALPGDLMPGDGHFVTSGFGISMNNTGDIVFTSDLDTDVNRDGVPDTGIYVWSGGSVRLVARTGTVIPGVGTIGQVASGVTIIPPPPSYFPGSGVINDHGQILFGVTLDDAKKTGVLLLASPHH